MFIQKLGFFLLQKNSITRYLLAFLFFGCVFTLVSLLEYSDYESPQYYHTDIVKSYKDILTSFHKYELQSKCKKEFCLKQEIQQLTELNPSFTTNQQYIDNMQTQSSHNIYAMYFTCQNLSCYEFIREVETIAPVFILKVQSFNTEILYSLETTAIETSKDSSSPLYAPLDSNNNRQPQKPSALQWKQNILLFFEIPSV
ncbi:hypothetical protein CQA66_05755 [Helicobacter aurati]|uniref:Transmembrane protein n=1 Tax=Helicobacter aurati TaxID=137778 RepID=A0A3D8J490_9HELI|nr:hypothetical protein [Helicobacter aurati]RDU71965.1 hypothetical protein CQA66_05755 [Helicobacter aurati]